MILLVLELSENTPTVCTARSWDSSPRHSWHLPWPQAIGAIGIGQAKLRNRAPVLRWEYHGKLMGKIGETHGIYMGFHGIYLGFD
jgi:hypothetical protein